MRKDRKPVPFLLLILLLFIAGVQPGSAITQPKKLLVGTKEAAPFSMQDENGHWHGISVDLWRDIADELNLAYEFRELELTDLLEGLENGSLDVAVAALTVTAERETSLDFTQPFYTTGLGIAIAHDGEGGWFQDIKRVFSVNFLKVVLLLAVFLFAVGTLVWLFERKRNPEQFGGSAAKGIGSAFWWSAVTMTTVGYGDKAPVSVAGRIVALVWMFASIIVISSFTAAITSALTVGQLDTNVKGPEDLPRVRTGTVEGSTSETYLTDRHIAFRRYTSVPEGLQAVADKRIDAMVYDEPILRYLSKTEFQGEVRVLPQTFQRQYYGIAFPENSSLVEQVNRALLERINGREWQETLYEYLGS